MRSLLKLLIFVIIASVLYGSISKLSDAKWVVAGLADFFGVLAGIFACDLLKESNYGLFLTYIILSAVLL